MKVLFRDSNRNAVDIDREKKEEEKSKDFFFGLVAFCIIFLHWWRGLSLGGVGLIWSWQRDPHSAGRRSQSCPLSRNGTRRADGKQVASGSWSFDVCLEIP